MNTDECYEDDHISDYTPEKMKYFEAIVRMHLSIARNVIKKSKRPTPYFYIDMTSASGKIKLPNDEIINGSPLCFLETIKDYSDLEYTAQFIEVDEEKTYCLERNIDSNSPNIRYNIYTGLHQSFVAHQMKFDDSKYGLVYLDPYGDFDDSIPAIKEIISKKPRLDILISFSASSIKRNDSRWETGNRLTDYMKDIGKQYWLIREPYSNKWQWSFILGSDTDIFKSYKRKQLYKIDSDEGKDILFLLDKTRNEMGDKVNGIEKLKRMERERKHRIRYPDEYDDNKPVQRSMLDDLEI